MANGVIKKIKIAIGLGDSLLRNLTRHFNFKNLGTFPSAELWVSETPIDGNQFILKCFLLFYVYQLMYSLSYVSLLPVVRLMPDYSHISVSTTKCSKIFSLNNLAVSEITEFIRNLSSKSHSDVSE